MVKLYSNGSTILPFRLEIEEPDFITLVDDANKIFITKIYDISIHIVCKQIRIGKPFLAVKVLPVLDNVFSLVISCIVCGNPTVVLIEENLYCGRLNDGLTETN